MKRQQEQEWVAELVVYVVKECVPGLAIISYRPIFLSESFWDRHVVCKNLVEFLMEFIEVDCEFSGMSGCEVMFWVYGDVWMIAFVGEEWRNSGSGT